MNDPQPGWTLDRALGRLAQGYAVEQVSRLSGYAVPFLRSQLHRADPHQVTWRSATGES